MSYEDIPTELTERPQWICWAEQTRNGQTTKIPKRPDGKGNAKANDMVTWATFEEAVEAAEKRENWGIGFVFSGADPYVGLDLDTCLAAPESPAKWLQNIGLSEWNRETYIERSPSQTGLHIILKDRDIPSWWTNQDRDTDDGHEGVEVYDDGRYFTFTGDTIETSADTVSADVDLEPWLRSAWEEFNDEPPRAAGTSSESGRSRTSGSSDDDINVDVHDVISRAQYPEEERRSHPVHGSDTGSNFQVDDGCETWRCWRHDVTGNALHLVGMQEGIIDCGDWAGAGLTTETWNEIFSAARDRDLDVGEKKSGRPSLDAAKQGRTDGGTATEDSQAAGASAQTPPSDGSDIDLSMEIDGVLSAFDEDEIMKKTALHRIAQLFCRRFDFIHPAEDSRGWRTTLYVFNEEKGVYEPRGERFASEQAELYCGDFLDNQQTNELVGKIKRMSGTRAEELEVPPYRLVVGNGILDLRCGELDEYTPDEPHRTRINVDYNPDAECERVDEFFHEIVEDNDVPTLYQLIAHGLYKEYTTEKAAMLLGEGQNGKSVFLSLVEEFLGGDNVSHRALQDFSENDYAANNLEGKLANVHPDMGDEMVRDLGTFKKLTGRDVMTADVKYERPITFENHATLLFAANRMPAMDEDTHALWRRWIYLNFPYTFDDNDPEAKDEKPKRVLMRELTAEEEMEGLLARCVEEIGEWWEGRDWFTNIMQPSQVREKMKRASEPVYDFATACLEHVEEDEEAYLMKDDVRTAYNKYAREEGLPAKSENVFGSALTNIRDFAIESGRRRADGARQRVYENVTWSARGRQVMGLDELDDPNQKTVDSAEKNHAKEIAQIVGELDSGDGVTKPMIVGRAQASMTLKEAQDGLESAKEKGLVQTLGGEKYSQT